MAWLFPSLRGYRSSWLRGDAIAGLSVWAVLVPEALAYATIAGVSPVVGLYAAPAALIFYAAFGSSRHLVVGPMSATAALSVATVSDLVAGHGQDFASFTAALAITTGAAALIAGLARLGFLASFISEPVLKGFIIGLALTIVIGQVPALLGVSKGHGDFFEQLGHVIGQLGDVDGPTAAVGLGSLALVLGLKRVAPRVPASLVAVAAGVAAVELLSLEHHGVAIVGHITAGLPSVGLPSHVSLHDYGTLAAGGIGVMLVGFAEGLGAAKTYASREHYDIDVNQELLGLGAANLAAGLGSGMVVNGSLSKTAVNGSSGANSQVSGLIVAALTLLTLVALTGLFEKLPEATLAAIVIAAVIELVDVGALLDLHRVWSRRLGDAYGAAARPDFIAAVAAAFGVLIFDTLPGLFIGIVVSVLLLLYRASRPRIAILGLVPGEARYADVASHPEYVTLPGAVVLRVESGLFFANADTVRDALRRHARDDGVTTVILDAQSIPSVDISAARMLRDVADELRRTGVALVLVHEIGQVRDVLRAVLGDDGTQVVYATVREAVAHAAD